MLEATRVALIAARLHLNFFFHEYETDCVHAITSFFEKKKNWIALMISAQHVTIRIMRLDRMCRMLMLEWVKITYSEADERARKEISNRRFDKYINFLLTICTALMFAFETFSLQFDGGWQRSDCECLHTQPLQFCVWNDIMKWNTLSKWYAVDSFDMCWITGRVFEFLTKIELITIGSMCMKNGV